MTQESLFDVPEMTKADANECHLTRHHLPESHAPRWSTCPRCGKPALKCKHEQTEYYRCAEHEIVLPDGSSYPAVYSAKDYNLSGVETQAQQMKKAKRV